MMSSRNPYSPGSSTAQGEYGFLEDIIPDGGTTDNAVRSQIAQYHLDVRTAPQTRIFFKPALHVDPQPIKDYNTGDIVRVRASLLGGDGFQYTRFDANVRIYGM